MLNKKDLNLRVLLFVETAHEDIVLSRMEGMRRSVYLLKRTLIDEPSDYTLPAT